MPQRRAHLSSSLTTLQVKTLLLPSEVQAPAGTASHLSGSMTTLLWPVTFTRLSSMNPVQYWASLTLEMLHPASKQLPRRHAFSTPGM